MPDSTTTLSIPSNNERLGVSVVWSYAFAVLLVLIIFLFLVPDADGPSPWDAEVFKARMLDIAANFRILDELADLGIVRVADVGDGLLNAKLSSMAVSSRRFGWAPFYLAVALVALALLLRGIRQLVLARHLGVSSSVPGQVSSYFFGRGLNLFFPFGAGDLGVAESLTRGGAAAEVAASVVFHNRLFELLGILLVLLGGFIYLGWRGAVAPVVWAVVLVVAVVSLTRPLGRTNGEGGRFNVLAHLWSVFNGKALFSAAKQFSARPGLFAALLLFSASTLLIEILGYSSIKQAFSSPMDDYVLMKDLGFVQFMIVVAVANAARILPYTFASLGIYEIVSIAMFQVFGEGPLSGATISFLDSLLLNGVTFITFVIALWLGRCPGVLETWRAFFAQSKAAVSVGAL
jgi:hypothetical protein